MTDLTHYTRRLEQTNHDIRNTNARLYEALVSLDPGNQALQHTVSNYPSSYVVLENMIEAAAAYIYATNNPNTADVDMAYESLDHAVSTHYNYWDDLNAEVQKRNQRGLEAAAKRANTTA